MKFKTADLKLLYVSLKIIPFISLQKEWKIQIRRKKCALLRIKHTQSDQSFARALGMKFPVIKWASLNFSSKALLSRNDK